MGTTFAWIQGRIARWVLAGSLALLGGLGTFAVAHAATATPAPSAAPSGSPGSAGTTTTHNCPNM